MRPVPYVLPILLSVMTAACDPPARPAGALAPEAEAGSSGSMDGATVAAGAPVCTMTGDPIPGVADAAATCAILRDSIAAHRDDGRLPASIAITVLGDRAITAVATMEDGRTLPAATVRSSDRPVDAGSLRAIGRLIATAMDMPAGQV